MIAARTGQPDLLYELDVPNLNINARDTKGWTALHHAADSGCCETVEFLLQRGADVNARTDEGSTPLSLAIVNNYVEAGYLIQAYGGKE
jgi:ankyrin repeat protein